MFMMFANDHDLNKICMGFFWTTVYKCCNDDLYTWRNVCFPVAHTEEEGRERKGGGGGKKSCKVPSVCFSVVCLIFAVVSYCQRVTWKHHVITVIRVQFICYFKLQFSTRNLAVSSLAARLPTPQNAYHQHRLPGVGCLFNKTVDINIEHQCAPTVWSFRQFKQWQ